ncbi:hypothetical protein CVIRNUC_004748 [Coccomyxa viridis]|uniref:Peptidyl-prolyl cis-trans isomerase n=1 Tax=Coccomyxa viridis TaxID=1274662 RepID=A0AAV1I6W0_9CHLO|nr:hypothetical protein CVIRNUC_004748 [Coccomyxa viridis]
MGGAASKPADIASLASSAVEYQPPLGPPNPENPLVYLDLSLGRYGDATPLGRVVIELKEDAVPKTAQNFKQLAESRQAGSGYQGSRAHRIIPGFMVQAGDFTNDNGTGGRSIYGAKFEDENFELMHMGPGILSMANSGPNTNGSQFFLTLARTPWLDMKHVVFGQVIEGFGVVKAAEACGSRSGETSFDVMIADCGVLSRSAVKAGTTAALHSGSVSLQQPGRHRTARSAMLQLQHMRSAFSGLPLKLRSQCVAKGQMRRPVTLLRPVHAVPVLGRCRSHAGGACSTLV